MPMISYLLGVRLFCDAIVKVLPKNNLKYPGCRKKNYLDVVV